MAANNPPILKNGLLPGEGGLMNLVAQCALEVRQSHDKTPWQPLIAYLYDPEEVSQVARNLGLVMLGEKAPTEVSPDEAQMAEWFIDAVENEKRLAKVLFKNEPSPVTF